MGRRAYGASSAGSGSAAASGGVSKVNTYANRATSFASPAAGDIFTASDSGNHQVYDGSAWRPIVGGGLGHEPADPSGWTWVNQGTSTMTRTSGRVHATFQDPGATVTWRGKHTTMADPSTAAIRVHVRAFSSTESAGTNNICAAGCYFRDSSNGNMLTIGMTANAAAGAASTVAIQTATWSAGSFTASTDYFPAGQVEWLALEVSSTNVLLRTSADGSTWVTVRTYDATLDTFDQNGIGACVYNANASVMWDSVQRA